MKEIEKAMGYSFDGGQPTWGDARFRTNDGRVIGTVRHSSVRHEDGTKTECTLAEDENGRAYWNYHETDGQKHCSKPIYSEDIAEVAEAAGLAGEGEQKVLQDGRLGPLVVKREAAP